MRTESELEPDKPAGEMRRRRISRRYLLAKLPSSRPHHRYHARDPVLWLAIAAAVLALASANLFVSRKDHVAAVTVPPSNIDQQYLPDMVEILREEARQAEEDHDALPTRQTDDP